MRRAGLRRTAAQLFERLARLEQPPLRDAQALVGLPLRDLELADRRARFLLPPIERVAFVLRLPFFPRELIALVREPCLLVGRMRELRVVGDRRFFLAVILGVQRSDEVRRLHDRPFELRGLLREASKRVAVGRHADAELLDLALGLEDAARVGAAAARDEMWTAKHIAVERGDRQRHRAAGRRSAVVRARDRRFADGAADRGAERTVDPNDRGQRHDTVGKRQRGGRLRSGERDLAGSAHRRAERAARRGRVYRRRDEEAAAPGVRVADQPEAGGRMLRPLHDHVLEEIAEARLDGALVARLDLEVVRNRSLLIHGAVGLE